MAGERAQAVVRLTFFGLLKANGLKLKDVY